MNRIVFLISVLALLLLFVPGCGSAEEPAADTAESVTGSVTEPPADSYTAGTAAFGSDDFLDDPRNLEIAADSVVRIESFDKTGAKIAVGSGFVAMEQNILVTACHVIVNMEYMIITTDSGDSFRTDRVIAADRATDVAVCVLPADRTFKPLICSEEKALRGEKVAVIGSQAGVTNLVSFGNVGAYWSAQDSEWLLFTAPVTSGSSGGPVLNSRGEVIGIVSGTYDNGQNLNIAATISKAISLYKAEAEGRS